MRILVVCTGNICRSPMAEALMRSGAAMVGLDAQIASVGSWESGVEADPHAVKAMADRGLDITSHRSHKMQPVDIEAADLIITMAAEHVVDVVGRVPSAFESTFTLKEFVERARVLGPKDPSLDLAIYRRLLNERRSRQDMLRWDQTRDVADPLGHGRRAFEKTATELEGLIWSALDLLTGYPPRN
jgi:protein-tyrosine-phosphatase